MSELKFTFHVNKPKAKAIAAWFAAGCKHQGYACEITADLTPRPDAIGVFYGVVPDTYAAFCFYKAQGRAIYLDNGWLSSPEKPTFRFAWNSAQPFLKDLPEPLPNWEERHGRLPHVHRKPDPRWALVVLQSENYFKFMRLGYDRAWWLNRVTNELMRKGYVVEHREKPTKRKPGESLFSSLRGAGIVVSLNSAATLKALRLGIPAFCTLDCTPSPLAPVHIPEFGRAAVPNAHAVAEMCGRVARYEVTRDQLHSGFATKLILRVGDQQRRGYWYGLE